MESLPEGFKESFLDLSKEVYEKIFASKPMPGLLWHYTTPSGLLGIFREQKVWLTNSSYLNDFEEVEHSRALLRAALEASVASSPEKEEWRNCLIRLLSRLEPSENYVSPAFVACFSEDGDSLPQWRAYGRGEGGFALGFSFNTLFVKKLEHWGARNIWLLPCIYDLNFQTDLSRVSACELMAIDPPKDISLDDLGAACLSRYSWAASCLKHPSFASENEWRLVLFVSKSDESEIFFEGSETLKPRLTYNFGQDGDFGTVLQQVVVGPQRHQPLAIRSIRQLLSQKHLGNVACIGSKVPFRSV